MIDSNKEALWKDGRLMAIAVKAMHEKFGREAIDVLCKAFYEYGLSEGDRYKEKFGYKDKEDEIDVPTAMKIYADFHKHIIAAGLNSQVVNVCATEREACVLECPIFDAWKSVWDKSYLMCEIMSKSLDEGFMQGLNPKLEWVNYPEKDAQEGLARGAKCCRVKLYLKD
jgi:hypothetical protein